MNRHPDIVKELASISPAVANLDHTFPLVVPEGYFESLPDKILQRIREMETPAEELESLSPLLAGMEKKTPFAVPEGYFESLASRVSIDIAATDQIEPAKPAAPARVVSIGSFRNWTRYAAAAVVTAVIAGSAFYFLRTQDAKTGELANQVVASGQKDTLPVSEDALLGFLDETDPLPGDDVLFSQDTLVPKDLAILELNENRITEILQELPDDALQAYMAENPEPGKTGSMN
jgi:hypothetical protein